MIQQIVRKALRAGEDCAQVARTALSKAGLDRSYVKVFAIGDNKTGTSSIHSLFGELGYSARYHNTKWRSTSAHWAHWKGQAFSDGRPQDFKALDRRFPRSKFILNTRDPLEWIDSRCEHIKLEIKEGIEHHHPAWQFSENAIKTWIQSRNRYHLEVMDYFDKRPESLLIVNFIRDPEAANKIAHFLGFPGDWKKPYSRSTSVTREPGRLKNAEIILSALKALGVPEAEWGYDLYFPSIAPPSSHPFNTC